MDRNDRVQNVPLPIAMIGFLSVASAKEARQRVPGHCHSVGMMHNRPLIRRGAGSYSAPFRRLWYSADDPTKGQLSGDESMKRGEKASNNRLTAVFGIFRVRPPNKEQVPCCVTKSGSN